MQGRLMAFASEAFRKVLVPGYRYARSISPLSGAAIGPGQLVSLCC
jgi:hypothetical protein